VALKHGEGIFAEVWFKPAAKPLALTFRISHKSFQAPGKGQPLTAQTLLNAVGISREEVESWRREGVPHSAMNGSISDLGQPLPPPRQTVTHLTIHVNVKQPPPQAVDPPQNDEAPLPLVSVEEDAPAETVASPENTEPAPAIPLLPETIEVGISEESWQELNARWKSIEGLEATVDTLRIRLEGLQSEMITAQKKTLTMEEKVHALGADLLRWNKAKSRVHFAIPKVREFVHRATWAVGAPERKRLGEFFKDDTRPDIPISQVDKLRDELENLLKDRQVLSGHGVSVRQECESISAEIQTSLRTLKANAATKARKARATRSEGKFFKDVRRLTGAD
jgi:hypothetical protein